MHITFVYRLWQIIAGSFSLVLMSVVLDSEQLGKYYLLVAFLGFFAVLDFGAFSELRVRAAQSYGSPSWHKTSYLQSNLWSWCLVVGGILFLPYTFVYLYVFGSFFYSWSAVYVCALGSVAFYNFLLTPNFIIQESSGNAESASLLKLGGSIIGYLCSWLLLYFITTPWIIFVQQFALLIVSVICLPRLFNTCLLFQPPSFKGVSSWYRCHFKKQLSIGFLDVNSYFQSQFFVIVFGSLYGVVYGGQFGITFAVSNMILALSQIPFLVRLHRISKVLDLSSGEKYSIRHEVGYILPSIIIFFFLMVAFNIFLKQNVIQHEFIDAVTSRFLPLDQVNLILLTTFFMMCGSFFSLFSHFKSVSYITLTMLFINISFLAISAAIEHLWQVKGVLVTVCAGSGLGAVVSFWLFRNLQRKNGSPRKIV